MATQAAPRTNGRQEAAHLYGDLEERLLARDQEGGSRVYYELLRRGRPLPEIMAEAVRIHAPYTHVPYHQRIDDGFPNFVNNDHCLLELARGDQSAEDAAGEARRAAAGADDLVHPVRARHLEPEDPQGARATTRRAATRCRTRRRRRRSSTGPIRSRSENRVR